MLTENGQGHAWRQQRKATGPAFNERNNALVWAESLKQVDGMLGAWSKMDGNTNQNMLLRDVHSSLADLSLHVISAAGFGIRLGWGGNVEGDSVTKFNSSTPVDGHKMTFKVALKSVLHYFLWFVAFDPKTLGRWGGYMPFDSAKELSTSWKETSQYWEELVDEKVALLRAGNVDIETTDLLGESARPRTERHS